MIGNFYTYVKDGNVSEVRRLLNAQAININKTIGINALVIAADNCQEKVFAELLKYPIDVYENSKYNIATLLHILISNLSFATLHPDKANKIYNMIRILLKTEAERRIRNPQDCRPFLEQISKNSGSTPLQLVESEIFNDLRNKITTIISEIETSYPEIINLKAQAETIANEHELTADTSVRVLPTLMCRRHILPNDNEPLLSRQAFEAAEPAQNSNTWSAFWNKLFSLVSNNRTDYENPTVKSR
jgi:hypothetical protein